MISPMKRKFAVFDIDGTLIRWQLFHAIVHHLGKEGYILRRTHESIKAARMHWKNRENDESYKTYENTLVEAYAGALKTIDPTDYQRIVDEIYEEYKDQTYAYTRDLIKDLKNRGYLLFAISGSQQEVIDRLAAHHGFDAAIGAKLIIEEGKFTGEIITPIFDKKSALHQMVADHDATYEGSFAVGDSPGDIAMLEEVQNPIVFNPDKKLFAEAKARKWPIVVERKNVIYELTPQDHNYFLSRVTENTTESQEA